MAMWLLEQFAFCFSGTLVKEMTSITICQRQRYTRLMSRVVNEGEYDDQIYWVSWGSQSDWRCCHY
jgi:hypothetical protein